ncbi:MAG: DDE transposase, partial [Candidatus Wallbacteria bacterium]|nr:DDE transposase [Candidatus Wallbacteria bacterium]
MASISQPYIFSWEHIDTASDLERLRLVLDVIPDERLMVKLEADRARGRDDYPIRAVWNTILAGVVFN